MKRRILLILGLWFAFSPVAQAQIFTGGRGDGATMSCVPPKVTTLGETDFRCVSDTIVLAIYASGSNLQYIWQKMGSNFYEDLQDTPHLLGLGTDTLRIIHPDKGRDDGRYRCLVKNTCDSDTSEVFVLDLNQPPYIETPLSVSNYAQVVCANQTPEIDLQSSIASLQGDHKYAWVKIDTLSGARTALSDTTSYAHIQVAGAALETEGLYVVTATNSCGVVSDSVFLPVYRAPEIVWENLVQGGLVSCVGEYLRLQASVSGGGSCMYTLEQVVYNPFTGEWEVLAPFFPDIPELIISSAQSSNKGYWRWKVENECGESISERVYLSIEETPNFAPGNPDVYLFPADTTICEGSSLELMCKATGETTRYYWLKDGERIVESDSNVLLLTHVKPEDAGRYTCVAYNSCMQTARSRSINVSLNLRPRVLRDPYLPRQVCLEDTLVRFKFQKEVDIPVDSIRWIFNENFIYDGNHYENTTTEELYVRFGGEPDLGLYQVALYNECGMTVSGVANLFDMALPVSFLKGVASYDALLCPGKEQRLSVAVSGSAPIHYKWVLNEHTYETDTNFVNVKGQSITEKNKYTVFAYNACGSAIDTGWLEVERFDYFNFIGNGEVCEDAEPTGYLELQGSDTGLMYTLYRDYGLEVETFKGTGDVVRFYNMPAGTYYITAENKATECIQEMAGRPEIVSLKSPAKFNFYVSSYYCPNSETNGAELLLTGWENGVTYTLEKLNKEISPDWQPVDRQTFRGGYQGYTVDEMNSPDAGEPRIYHHIDAGRYRVVAKNPLAINACTRTVVLADSIYLLDQLARHKLIVPNNDTVNCIRIVNGEEYQETTTLEVDRFIEGATYTLYKDGQPDPSHEPDRTAPISWSGITEGVYSVHIDTKQGCPGETVNQVRIHKVKAPLSQSISASGDPCTELDVEDRARNYKTIYIDNTEMGIKYALYQQAPHRLVDEKQGTGTAIGFQVPYTKATYTVVATDATGMCPTSFEDTYTTLASNFVVAMNPADIFLDGKGKTTWLHMDVTGDYVQPLDVQWWQESQLQQTGLTNLPNGQYYQHLYWPFCPCNSKHDSWGNTRDHGYGDHNSNCTLNDCPFLYHTYDPRQHGCVYLGTTKRNYTIDGRVRNGNWYDLYFCKDGVDPDASLNYYENDTLNPFRNRLTTPVNEDRKYAVTVTDGAGCVHTDSVDVRVMGGKLRAEIMHADFHRHWEYPSCPCAGKHYYHVCNSSCNDQNCPVLYHAHRHEGCTLLHTQRELYNGAWRVYYRDYACCSNIEAQDTIVNRNSKLFFCSEARGGDYNYVKTWSYEVPGDAGSSWGNQTGDSIVIDQIKESGWLHLRVTSMGQEVRDSIWIEVVRQKLIAAIQDVNGHNIDTVKVCRGEELYLYAFTDGGDGESMFQWYGDGDTGPNERMWVFRPQQSGNVVLTVTNDGVVVRDTAYIRLQDRPTKPEIENPGTRCVTDAFESIKVLRPTDIGANYVLEFSRDSGVTYTEYKRVNDSQGGAIEFRVNEASEYIGLFRVKVEGNKDSDACDTYSDVMEFIGQPTHNDYISDSYCYSDRRTGLTVRLNSTEPDMSYSILFDDDTWKETIHAPLNFFDGPLTRGDYKIVYTRQGIMGSCSDTVPLTVKEIAPAQIVDVIINNGSAACEGMNATITIPASESQVKYYLKSVTTGEKLELFTGNGSSLSANIPARSAGTYQVIAELEGCETQVDLFNFYKKPEQIEQEDVEYCYPYGTSTNMSGTELVYTGLKPGITYTLVRDGREIAALTGGGTKTFTDVIDGDYLLISKDNTTGCTSETAFRVDAKRGPKDFVLAVDCAKEKNVTLENSQENVFYVLYRDTLALDTLYGTGSALAFGVQNVTGKYTVVATDSLSGCSELMDGEVIINEIGYCDLIQETPICEIVRPTALLYPCSKTGWDYYLKNVTDPDNPVSSDTKSGNGGEIVWETMGPGGDIMPTLIGRNQYKPSQYVLYGKDECGDIPLDTIWVELLSPPKGTLQVGSVTLTQAITSRTKSIRACENELMEFFLSNVVEGIECTLVGILSNNYVDTLTHFVTTAEHVNRTSIGSFRGGYSKYICYLKDGTCTTQMTLSISYKDMPNTNDLLIGNSVCKGDGALEIRLGGKTPEQNYYLVREGTDRPVDTILYTETGRYDFNPQTEEGRYYVLAENIDLTPDGLRFTPVCRDTLANTFAVGDAPVQYNFVSWPERKQEIYLCLGEQKRASLLNSESTVDYILVKDGVEYGEPQHKVGGGRLTFGIEEGGEYTVRGYVGNCKTDMLGTITVYADTMPHLKLYDTYYYCRDEEGGAKIEIEDAPMYTIAELKAGGTSAWPLDIDTVQQAGDTLKFDVRCVQGDIYYLSIRTFGGCQFDHPFTVEKKAPPKDLKVFLTANAICEGECTKVAILGDEGNVEYELRTAYGDNALYNDNFIMGFGDRDTLWFPYAICETGNYQVVATMYDRPYCETVLPYNNEQIVALADHDTIRELSFEFNELHYCADNGTAGATIAIPGAQEGVEYYLFRGDSCLDRAGFPRKIAAVDGDRIEWTRVPAFVKCEGEGDFYTTYRVRAKNPVSGCEKWMKDSVRVYGDGYVNGLAITQPDYDFCEGGSVLLKARAEGCGLQYNWKHRAYDGTVAPVGLGGPDLLLENATSDMSGQYYCEISNACNSVSDPWISPEIDVKVRDLVDMDDIESMTICEGTSDKLYSKILNVSEGDYAWYRENEPGNILSTRSYLALNHITMDMQGYYVCRGGRVEDGYCNTVYDTIYIEVAKNVDSLQIHVDYDTLCVGSSLSLSMVGQVPSEYTGKWYHNGEDMGLYSTGYRKDGITRNDAGIYTVELQRTSGATCGDTRLKTIAVVTVDSLITPLWWTEDKELCQAQKIALSVRTMPMSGVRFEWTRIVDGAPEEMVGYGEDVLTEVPEGASNVIYKAYYYNKCSAAPTGNNMVSTNVNISQQAGFAVNLPDEITGCEGDQADVTLRVEVQNTTVLSYVWTFTPASSTEVDTVDSGNTNSSAVSYTLPYDHEHSGFYTCILQTDCGRMVSNACWVRVNTPARILHDLTASNGKMCEGSYYTPQLTATGSDLQFRWFITYPDGRVDTVRRAIGYDWEATDQLDLLTETKYNGAKLQCKVWNNCSEDLSEVIDLEIIAPRSINVIPAETWLCADSTATVEVELLGGDGDAWNYKLQRDDYDPTAYAVDAGYTKDTIEDLISGRYAVVNLNDGICDYRDKVMAEFLVNDLLAGSATFGLASGRRDTMLCTGSGLPMYVKVTGGTGPYQVGVYYKTTSMTEPAIYNEWMNTNPFVISAEAARRGYSFSMPVSQEAEFSVQVVDLANDKPLRPCPLELGNEQVIRVTTEARLATPPALIPTGRISYGECELDIDLRVCLNVMPEGGTFQIIKQAVGGRPADTLYREWTFAKILRSDGPGLYSIGYFMNNTCKDAATPINIKVDSLPYVKIVPEDTLLCCGNGSSPNIQAYMYGAAPFDELKIETSRLKVDGSVVSPPGVTITRASMHGNIPNPYTLAFHPTSSCNDSVARMTVTYVKDKYGCAMPVSRQAETRIRIRKLPQLEVVAYHPQFSGGYGDPTTEVFNLRQGDSVTFRVSLSSKITPWTLNFSYLTSAPPAVPDEQYNWTITGTDTLVTVKKEGYYIFTGGEVGGCPASEVRRDVHLTPPGYISIQGLFLGGALAHLVGTAAVDLEDMRMRSNLWGAPGFPDYGYDLNYMYRTNGRAIIDWVFVEARTRKDNGTWVVVDRDTCLLLEDGKVVNREFNEAIKLEGTGVSGEKFYVAVFHRNHLPVMTPHPQQFGPSSPATISFGRQANYYCSNKHYVISGGNRRCTVDDHVWKFWTYYGQPIYVMAPSYKQINKRLQLVSMSNAVQTYFELDQNHVMSSTRGYYIWDVTCNGRVEIPNILNNFTGLPTAGQDEDAWMLFKNRDKFVEEDLDAE